MEGRALQLGGLRNLRGGAAQRELSQRVKRQLAQCQVGQILKVADHCAEHMTLDGAVAALQTLARDPEFKANGKDRRVSSILDIYRKSLVPGTRLEMRQLTTSCWAFARLQVYDGPLLAALQDAVVEKAQDMSSQELSSTAWAFARLELADPAMLSSLLDAVNTRVAQPCTTNEQLMPQHVANVLYLAAAATEAGSPLFETLLPHAKARLADFAPRDLCSLAWAVARSPIQQLPLLWSISNEVLAKRHNVEPLDFVNIMRASAETCLDSEKLAEALHEALECRLPDMRFQELGHWMWAHWKVGMANPKLMATINRQAAMKRLASRLMAAASALPLSNAELRARLLSQWFTPDQALQSAGLRDRWRLTEAELRELFEAEVEATSSPEQVSLEKQRAISAAGRWRLRVEAGVQRLCAQLQKQDPDSVLPMIPRRELLFALSQSAPREGFRAWAARRCTADDWEELRHTGPASGYLDLESFCEMVVLEAGHIDDAKEWFQHLKDLNDGSTCISYALLHQTAVCCPKLPGAADSAAPWEPIELLPRLLSVWTDLTEAFGWERQELGDVIRDRQQDELTQTTPRVSHQQWLRALRGKQPEWPLLSETEAQEEAHRLGALGLTAGRLFPNLSDRLQVTKNLFLPGELIVVRYTLSDFGHYGVSGPSPMVLGPDLPLGKAPFVAAVPAQPELAGFEEAWSRSALDVSLPRGAVRLRAPGALRGTSAFWHLRIFASDDGRTPTSAVSAPLLIQVMTVPPAPPSEVVAEGRDTSISFKWAECAQNGGAAVDRYDIALRYAESSKLAWTGHAQEPVIIATSLTPDCDYMVQVRGANRAGCGPWSPGFAARTAARPPAPQVLAVGRDTVLLRLPVEKAGNLTGYVVKAVCCTTGEPETSDDSEIVKRSGPKQTEVLLTGLLCATSYRLCAARLNASDQGPWSTCIQVRTKAGTPLPPENLTCLVGQPFAAMSFTQLPDRAAKTASSARRRR
ncbi:Fndc3a [Symbiodinium sp. CCMP2456]|nr:Fndc3a [Symbiodinium sp. CCMP2456]